MSDPSIGLAFNIYDDANALPGLLECGARFFDDMVAVHAGPGGACSTDGTIELLEKWGVRIVWRDMLDGFGVIRTECIRASRAEWVMILDADERFHPVAPVLECAGTDRYPETERPDLRVTVAEPAFNQGDLLRRMAAADDQVDAIRTCRRHWFDFSFRRPCENWTLVKDWQLRVVRNRPWMAYDSAVKMHERLLDTRTGGDPRWMSGDARLGPFHDHYHCFFKPMEVEQRRRDIELYDRLAGTAATS